MKTIKKIVRLLFKAIKWTFIFIVILAVISALYNLTLPTRSKITLKLQYNEKAFIAETINLQQKMGNAVWPGWGDLKIPVIVYNEEYAFLIGYPEPPAGWKKMPQEEFRGSQWQVVENDDFFGRTYYCQPLPNPDITPENFTVKVGERWAVTMQTKEFAAVDFYSEFKNELPPVLNAVFPYKIFWNLLMGKAENYIGGMAHEAFHAFQGTIVPQRLADGENATRYSTDYPWENPDNAEGWKKEAQFLVQAYKTENIDSARFFVMKFIEIRTGRRNNSNLTPAIIGYEQNREWLEGLAKYAELKIGVEAENSSTYQPVTQIENVSGFKNYEKRNRYLIQQIAEVKRTAARQGESRFYYIGMLQAVMLDRLMPDWKETAFKENVMLDDLLKKAVYNV